MQQPSVQNGQRNTDLRELSLVYSSKEAVFSCVFVVCCSVSNVTDDTWWNDLRCNQRTMCPVGNVGPVVFPSIERKLAKASEQNQIAWKRECRKYSSCCSMCPQDFRVPCPICLFVSWPNLACQMFNSFASCFKEKTTPHAIRCMTLFFFVHFLLINLQTFCAYIFSCVHTMVGPVAHKSALWNYRNQSHTILSPRLWCMSGSIGLRIHSSKQGEFLAKHRCWGSLSLSLSLSFSLFNQRNNLRAKSAGRFSPHMSRFFLSLGGKSRQSWKWPTRIIWCQQQTEIGKKEHWIKSEFHKPRNHGTTLIKFLLWKVKFEKKTSSRSIYFNSQIVFQPPFSSFEVAECTLYIYFCSLCDVRSCVRVC